MKIHHSLALIIGLIIAGSAAGADAGERNRGVAPPWYRFISVKTYADLGAEWWQWALQAPAADNPVMDETGEDCAIGQRGPVWFLAGKFGSGDPAGEPTERTCDRIPRGKAFFFPLINEAFFAFLNDPPEERTPEFLRSQLQCTNIRNLSASIDGQAVARLKWYRTTPQESPLFDVQLPTDAVFGLTEDIVPELLLSPSVHQGYYLYLRPLPPGKHVVEWTATWDCPQEFSENIRYTLIVREDPEPK